MSQTSKIVLGIAVVVAVLAGAYYYWQKSHAPTESSQEVTSLPSGSDASDTALEQDLSSINAQIDKVGTDNSDVSASISASAAAE